MAKSAALARPVQPDDVLADIIGSDRPMPRTQIVKKVWDYIKKHGLQDPDDKRVIVADSLLRDLFNGKKESTMLQLAGYISKHVD
jgi:chromatin remodeling complex protein RSC6